MTGTGSVIGQTVSHYCILEKLGGSGMGVVYKLEDINLNRFVALKFFPDDEVRDQQALARFQCQVQAADAPNHPNICKLYGVGRQDNTTEARSNQRNRSENEDGYA
jgi:serine/threonine protein kinase